MFIPVHPVWKSSIFAPQMPEPVPYRFGPSWRTAERSLIALFAVAALLNMIHQKVPFLTTHAADLSCPAFLYIGFRSRWLSGRRTFPTHPLGRSPEFTALTFFLASTATEISQYFAPHGLFPGRFDPWDVIAYAAAAVCCYTAEKLRWGMVPTEHP